LVLVADWQDGEREADEDLAAGRSEVFESDEALEYRLARTLQDDARQALVEA
jgi:hypothetical protein